MNSRDPPSRILLLIITHLPQQFPLTNDFLHEIFSSYGNIKKILIFERGKANKSFVEFHDLKSAISARKSMLGKNLAHCGGKIQIHFSKLRNLDLEVVDESRGSEYSYLNQEIYQQKSNQTYQPTQKQDSDDQKYSSSFKSLDIIDRHREEDDKLTAETNQANSDESIRKSMEMLLDGDFQEEKLRSCHYSINKFQIMNSQEQQLGQLLVNQPLQQTSQQHYFQSDDNEKMSSIKPKMNGNQKDCLKENGFITKSRTWRNIETKPQKSASFYNNQTSSSTIFIPISPVIEVRDSCSSSLNKFIKNADIQALITQKISRILILKSLENPKINVSTLYNLFSRFGNIDNIVHQNEKKRVIITFQNAQQATVVKAYLSNLFIYGTQLRILFFNDELILNPNFDEVIKYSRDAYKIKDINSVLRPSTQIEIVGQLTNHFQQILDSLGIKLKNIDQKQIINLPTLQQTLEFLSKSNHASPQLRFI